MAKTHKIKHVDDTFTISKSNDTWIFLKSASIKSGADENAITEAGTSRTTIILQNNVIARDVAIASSGNHVRIEIDHGASITAGNIPIVLQGDNALVINRGTLDSNDGGSSFYGIGANLELHNYGRMTSIPAAGSVSILGDGARIYNEKSGRMEGGVGMGFSLDAGDSGTFYNRGVVAGDRYAVGGADGNDTVINRGKLVGMVSLFGGDDKVDTRGGTLSTKVFEGGLGDDVLLTDNAKYTLVEKVDEGNDTIKSTVSYRLADNSNVENLVLIGTKNVNATGSAQYETIRGNSGNNRIDGGGSFDDIYGGKGSDTLTGGGIDTEDYFYFKTGDGHDVITDFEPGDDQIHLTGWHGFDSYQDVLDHARFRDGDMIIKAGKDSIVLLDVDQDNISGGDFSFTTG